MSTMSSCSSWGAPRRWTDSERNRRRGNCSRGWNRPESSSLDDDRPTPRPLLGRQVRAVHDDTHLLERDQSAADHLVETREDRGDLLLRLHALDHDRRIGTQPEPAALMHTRGGAGAEDPAEDRV